MPCTGKCVEDNGSFSCVEPPGKCTDGAKRCNGESLESCVGGVWTALPCTGKCVENNGSFSCVEPPSESCEKGATKCDDDGTKAVLWTCSDAGTWTQTDCPPSEIEGARLTCLKASSCSTVLCPEGTLFNSEKKVCQEHNHSNACTAGRTYCNGKTNYLYECLETGNEAPTSATDCTAEGKVCIKIDDDHSECAAEECAGNYCIGEVLHYCTKDHKFDTEIEPMDCTQSDRICDINEYGEGECFDPECIHEEETRCVAGDNTKIETCTNKRWVESKCSSGTCNEGKCK
ncbi:MAG: hypothetical protein IJU23_06825 [Proteobacteria bacterium]|nr:hypothetical protein [Pseudomonadota bacterium]